MKNLNRKRTFNMSNIHPCFKTKKVLQHIANMIIDYNYTNYLDLSDGDKREIASLLIEAAGDSAYEFLVESTDAGSIISAVKKALCGTSTDNDLSETIQDAAVNYYEHTMEALFDWVFDDYTAERNEWFDSVAKHGDPDEAKDRYLERLWI